MRARLLSLVFVLAGGCHWALNDPGTNPPKDELYFPAGIAIDPSTQFAYVSNANADLKYGGGTVQMFDVLRFECALAAYRSEKFRERASHGLDGPTGKELGRCAAFNAAEDASTAYCQPDPRDGSVIDCNEAPFVLGGSTVKVGNFAGVVRLLKREKGGHRVFVGVRGDPSITFIDATLPGNRAAPPEGLLNCFNEMGERVGSPPGCDATTHLVQEFACTGFPSCANRDDHNMLTPLPSEPFGMSFDDPARPSQLLVAHLASGQVSLIDLLDNQDDRGADIKPKLEATSVPMFPVASSGLRGAFALAPRPLDHPMDTSERKLWYLTSNLNAIIATFRIADAKQIIPTQQFTIQSTFLNGNDVREIVFDTKRQRAFLTDGIPPSVVMLDTGLVESAGGKVPANVVTGVVDVCQTPSHMGLRHITYPDGSVRTRLVVVCFLSSQVMLVDPDRPGVDDTIFSGLGGPNDLAFTFDDEPDPVPNGATDPQPLRHAWVTNFTESTISVVDLDPNSATQNQVIARLGFPPDGRNRGIQ
jgi:hypothetical protein